MRILLSALLGFGAMQWLLPILATAHGQSETPAQADAKRRFPSGMTTKKWGQPWDEEVTGTTPPGKQL